MHAARHFRESESDVTQRLYRRKDRGRDNRDTRDYEQDWQEEESNMATQQEREAFLRGWHAAMDEVLAVLVAEAHEYAQEENDAATSGEYKLPGSFALREVHGSLKGRHDLRAWLTAAHGDDPALIRALDALVEDRASDADRAALGLTTPTER
jgi:hypothetical protein